MVGAAVAVGVFPFVADSAVCTVLEFKVPVPDDDGDDDEDATDNAPAAAFDCGSTPAGLEIVNLKGEAAGCCCCCARGGAGNEEEEEGESEKREDETFVAGAEAVDVDEDEALGTGGGGAVPFPIMKIGLPLIASGRKIQSRDCGAAKVDG